MIPNELQEVLRQDPKIMSGEICFAGTRVPVQALLDTLFCGETVDYFLDGFPAVSREQAEAVLRWEQNEARRSLGMDLVA